MEKKILRVTSLIESYAGGGASIELTGRGLRITIDDTDKIVGQEPPVRGMINSCALTLGDLVSVEISPDLSSRDRIDVAEAISVFGEYTSPVLPPEEDGKEDGGIQVTDEKSPT